MSEKLLARFLLDQDVKPGVTCSSADRKKQQISTGKLLALVFLEGLFDWKSGKFPISRKKLLAPLVLAPYVGDWVHHDYGITINANGTGTNTQYFGFTCDNGNRACGGTGKLIFRLEAGAIIGTYTSLSYDPGVPSYLRDIHVGDSFQLSLAPHDRIIFRWLGRQSQIDSMSLCGPHTSLEFWDCGA